MTSTITRVLLLLAMASPATAAEPYEPWPTKDQLRSIEQAAYACSRDNSTQACRVVRQLADPLMDFGSMNPQNAKCSASKSFSRVSVVN